MDAKTTAARSLEGSHRAGMAGCRDLHYWLKLSTGPENVCVGLLLHMPTYTLKPITGRPDAGYS